MELVLQQYLFYKPRVKSHALFPPQVDALENEEAEEQHNWRDRQNGNGGVEAAIPAGEGDHGEGVDGLVRTGLTISNLDAIHVKGVGADKVFSTGDVLREREVGWRSSRCVACDCDVIQAGLIFRQVVFGGAPCSFYLTFLCKAQLGSDFACSNWH